MIEKYRKPAGEKFELNTSREVMLRQGQLYQDCHKPTHAELIEYGYFKEVTTVYESATHKLLDRNEPTNWVQDGDETYLCAIKLTTEELAERADTRYNTDMAELDRELLSGQKLDDMFLLATGQETLVTLTEKYRADTGKPDATLPLQDLMNRKAARRINN